MYNLIWNIYIGKYIKGSSNTLRLLFNKDESDPLFEDIWPNEYFLTGSMESLEEQIIDISANYLRSLDPYNKLIDSTNINFNYINDETNP